MGLDSEVPLSKALVGAVFIQYVLYASVYIIEGIKNDESADIEDPKATTAA
jgi:hypothetical protein